MPRNRLKICFAAFFCEIIAFRQDLLRLDKNYCKLSHKIYNDVAINN